jgi:GntR family transcriptional regulator / MocR family aminotransferase
MDLTPILHPDSDEPLYVQLYQAISREIAAGRIPAGTRLPSIRQLARSIGVGKITVEAAYQQLLAEGYIVSRERSGYFAADIEAWADSSTDERPVLPTGQKKRKGEHLSLRYNFHGSVVDTRHFPYALWRSCLMEAMDRYSADFAYYGDDQGEWELRVELARYLRRARTLVCEPEQIVIGTGLQQAIIFLCLMLRDDHQVVAMEEPGYADARVVFEHHGFRVVPVPLEEDGLSVDVLERSGATVVYVTPAHQYPHGMVMPVAKRLRLLQWAKACGGIIIENDYDGEFRYNVKPTPSLQGMDQAGTVVYIGNFSKAFSPALRMNYTVLPPALLGRYLESFQAYPSPVPRLEQRAMQLFMQKGYWEKHVRKMRTIYQKKHAILLQAIADHLHPHVTVLGHSVGLHILLEVHTDRSEEELIRIAAEAGVGVYPVGRNWQEPCGRQERPRIIVGFGGMREEDISEGIRLLAAAWFGRC